MLLLVLLRVLLLLLLLELALLLVLVPVACHRVLLQRLLATLLPSSSCVRSSELDRRHSRVSARSLYKL